MTDYREILRLLSLKHSQRSIAREAKCSRDIFSSSFIGAFQAMVTGCGFVELGFAIGILDGVVCKIGFGKLFGEVFHMGAIGYFWGISTSRILPGLLCFAYFMSGKWRTRKLLGKAGKTPEKRRRHEQADAQRRKTMSASTTILRSA